MARCPNCGRETERTIDWACKWCGYPLQSRTFKRIEKTWRQIKEERSGIVSTPEREPEPERRPEPGRYTPEPRQVLKPRLAPEPQRKPERRPAPAPKPRRVEPEPEPEPELIAEAEPEPEPAPELEAEPALVTEEEVTEEELPEEEPEAKPEQEVETRPAPEQRMAPRPAAPRPSPPVQPEPQPSTPSFQTTVEQIRTAYKNDELGTHEKLKNKAIRVTGIVDKIEVNDARAIYNVLLTGKQKGDEFRDVECRFAKQYGPELSRLTVGETITVDGTYTGYVINIILRQCAMVG